MQANLEISEENKIVESLFSIQNIHVKMEDGAYFLVRITESVDNSVRAFKLDPNNHGDREIIDSILTMLKSIKP